MTTSYRYNEPEKQQFDVLPPGEYEYTVIEAQPPSVKPSGNLVLPVKLAVGTEKKHVYDYPWYGDKGDKIAQFLASCNRAPEVGQEPNWNKLLGAKGRCKIVIEPSSGQYPEKNKVSYYVFTTDIKNGAKPQTYTPEQVTKGSVSARKAAHDPDLDTEPSDIPF